MNQIKTFEEKEGIYLIEINTRGEMYYREGNQIYNNTIANLIDNMKYNEENEINVEIHAKPFEIPTFKKRIQRIAKARNYKLEWTQDIDKSRIFGNQFVYGVMTKNE